MGELFNRVWKRQRDDHLDDVVLTAAFGHVRESLRTQPLPPEPYDRFMTVLMSFTHHLIWSRDQVEKNLNEARAENDKLKAEIAALQAAQSSVGTPVCDATPAAGADKPCEGDVTRIPLKVQALRARFPDTVVDGHPPLSATGITPSFGFVAHRPSIREQIDTSIKRVVEPDEDHDLQRVMRVISPPPD